MTVGQFPVAVGRANGVDIAEANWYEWSWAYDSLNVVWRAAVWECNAIIQQYIRTRTIESKTYIENHPTENSTFLMMK